MKTSKEILHEIYTYDDYVIFLKEYFTTFKGERGNRRFSYRAFSRKVGISSPNLIGLILDNKRSLSNENAQKIANGLNLKTRKRRYFLSMVGLKHSKGIEADKFFKEMIRIKKSSNFIHIEEKQYRYYEQWYYAVIRELACLKFWRGDYSKLGRACSPSISAIEAERAVKLLLEIDILKFENGEYKLSNENITSEKVPPHKKYADRKSWLSIGIDATDNYSSDIRNTQYKTINLLKSDYSKVEKIINETDKKIEAIINDSAKDEGVREIYEFITNFFPVSNIQKEIDKDNNK